MRVKDLCVLRLVILRLACQFLLGLFGARQELPVSQVVIGTFLGGGDMNSRAQLSDNMPITLVPKPSMHGHCFGLEMCWAVARFQTEIKQECLDLGVRKI